MRSGIQNHMKITKQGLTIRRPILGDMIRICNDSNGLQPADVSPFDYRVDALDDSGIPSKLSARIGRNSRLTIPVPHPSRLKFVFATT